MILLVIIFARRVLGIRTFGLYLPLTLTILLTVIGWRGVLLFMFLFGLVSVLNWLLKKIALFSMTDDKMLDAVVLFAVVMIFYFELNIVSLLAVLIMCSYIEDLLKIWETKGFKRFIFAGMESLGVVAVSCFLINWSFVKNMLLHYPFGIIVGFIILIIILAKWKGLKLKEYIEFKEIIKHAKLSEKK